MPSAAARPSARERAIAARATMRKLGPGLIAPSVIAAAMPRRAGMVSIRASALLAHELAQVRRGDGTLEVAERALLLHLARGLDQAGHCRAPERGREADAAHAGSLELGDAERLALDARHEVEGPGKRGAYPAHGVEVGKSRRHQDVGAGLLESLQALDGVVEVRSAAHEVLSPGRENKIMRARDLCRSGDALDCMLEVVDLVARCVLNRATRQADARGEADGLRRRRRLVGKAVLQIRRHRQLGGLDDRARVLERLLARDV